MPKPPNHEYYSESEQDLHDKINDNLREPPFGRGYIFGGPINGALPEDQIDAILAPITALCAELAPDDSELAATQSADKSGGSVADKSPKRSADKSPKSVEVTADKSPKNGHQKSGASDGKIINKLNVLRYFDGSDSGRSISVRAHDQISPDSMRRFTKKSAKESLEKLERSVFEDVSGHAKQWRDLLPETKPFLYHRVLRRTNHHHRTFTFILSKRVADRTLAKGAEALQSLKDQMVKDLKAAVSHLQAAPIQFYVTPGYDSEKGWHCHGEISFPPDFEPLIRDAFTKTGGMDRDDSGKRVKPVQFHKKSPDIGWTRYCVIENAREAQKVGWKGSTILVTDTLRKEAEQLHESLRRTLKRYGAIL